MATQLQLKLFIDSVNLRAITYNCTKIDFTRFFPYVKKKFKIPQFYQYLERTKNAGMRPLLMSTPKVERVGIGVKIFGFFFEKLDLKKSPDFDSF